MAAVFVAWWSRVLWEWFFPGVDMVRVWRSNGANLSSYTVAVL